MKAASSGRRWSFAAATSRGRRDPQAWAEPASPLPGADATPAAPPHPPHPAAEHAVVHPQREGIRRRLRRRALDRRAVAVPAPAAAAARPAAGGAAGGAAVGAAAAAGRAQPAGRAAGSADQLLPRGAGRAGGAERAAGGPRAAAGGSARVRGDPGCVGCGLGLLPSQRGASSTRPPACRLCRPTGSCERLYTQPIAPNYTSHTARFLILWMMFMPLGLWSVRARLPRRICGAAALSRQRCAQDLRWGSLLFAPAMTYLAFAIDEIGVQLEEPFSVLPLAALCRRIAADAAEIVARASSVRLAVARWREVGDASCGSLVAVGAVQDFAGCSAGGKDDECGPPAVYLSDEVAEQADL